MTRDQLNHNMLENKPVYFKGTAFILLGTMTAARLHLVLYCKQKGDKYGRTRAMDITTFTKLFSIKGH